MRKVYFFLLLASFTVLMFHFVSTNNVYGCGKWVIECGCQGSGCVGGYVPESERFDGNGDVCGSDCGSTYYSPKGTKITEPSEIINDALKTGGPMPSPGQTGYISGTLPDGSACVNEACFAVDPITKEATYLLGGIDNISGFGVTYVGGTAATQMFGIKFVQISTSSNNTDNNPGCIGAACFNNTPTPAFIWVTATPTPTPTPAAVLSPWVKLKDASFNSLGRIQSYIPAAPVAYDADDTTQPYFIVGDGGVVTAESIALKGLNAGAKAGTSDWQDSPYSMIPAPMSSPNFISYIKGKKQYKEITSLDQINSDGIYLYKSKDALDISTVPSAFDLYNVVLVTETTVNIKNTNDYFKPTKSIAIVSPFIYFASNVKEAKGIFITIVTNTGTTTDEGLKITGNLIARDELQNGRKWINKSRPSLFIVFRPDMYLDLLPYLSVVNYNWQQLQ